MYNPFSWTGVIRKGSFSQFLLSECSYFPLHITQQHWLWEGYGLLHHQMKDTLIGRGWRILDCPNKFNHHLLSAGRTTNSGMWARTVYKLTCEDSRKEKARGLLLQRDTNILPVFGNQPFCNTCLYIQGFPSCVQPLPYIGPWEMGVGSMWFRRKSLVSYTNRVVSFQTDTSLVLTKQHRSLTQVDLLATSVVSGLTLPLVLDKQKLPNHFSYCPYPLSTLEVYIHRSLKKHSQNRYGLITSHHPLPQTLVRSSHFSLSTDENIPGLPDLPITFPTNSNLICCLLNTLHSRAILLCLMNLSPSFLPIWFVCVSPEGI